MNNAEIAARRLHQQGLSKIIFKDAHDAVTQLGAVQAQDYAGAKWALGQRLQEVSDFALDKGFNDGSLLRTHLLRPTWHFVSPEDIRWLLKLTAPRVHAANAFMYRRQELNQAVFKKSYQVLEKALHGNKHLTREELGSALTKAGINTESLRLTYIMMSAELDAVVCSGPRRGKQFTYALLEERAPHVRSWTRDEALAELMRRYFSTRGPATLQDFTWWSGLTMAEAKRGIEMLNSEFIHEEINGQTNWFPDIKPVKVKSPSVYLLPNYDEYFIGFKDRSAMGEVAARVEYKADDPALLAHVIILDGQFVGGWRRILAKDTVTVELNPITKLNKVEKQAVASAAERFGKFLNLKAELKWIK